MKNRPRVVVVLTALFLMVTTSGAVALPSDPPMASQNIRHLANVPKQPPFDGMFSPMTDLAFTGRYAIAGNFEGFTVFDIGDPRAPRLVTQVSCPGPQNDLSVAGDLLFLSTDDPRSTDSCQSSPAAASDPAAWEGVKIFDISDIARPATCVR